MSSRSSRSTSTTATPRLRNSPGSSGAPAPGTPFSAALRGGSALLRRFQGEEYDGGIQANRDDFSAAARIYAAINGDAGGQETKMTENEAGNVSDLL
ncbi:MAG: hypothetical protein PHW59_12640 [Desulfobacterales bacterium]|nr:hypothetical protein [Methanoculleus sp.]MDD3951961.1 hypothetical protein [Desulfobacterales bacterium]